MRLIPAPYRILALVMLTLSCIGFGFVLGISRESDRRDARALTESRASIAVADKESTRREALGSAREVSRERVRTVYLTIKEKADEVIKTNPAVYDCSLDSDGLRAWNAANAADATPLSGEPYYQLPDTTIGKIGKAGRPVAESHRVDGAIRAMPRPTQEAGGVREPSPQPSPVNERGG